MYPGGVFYGIKEILLAYANLPKFFPLPVAVQHGWQRVAHEFESSTNPPEIWVWSSRIARELEQFYPRERIRVVGSFFCYLIKSLQINLPMVERQGSVCIPPHSSHLAKSVYSVESFAQSLNELGKDFMPIRVMLYYLDMNEQVVSIYEKYGFEVVSNGELYDSNFLKKFVTHVNDKKYCIFSDLGSGVIYSTYLGLKPYHIDISTKIDNFGNYHVTEKYIADSMMFDKKFLSQISDGRIKEEIGEEHMLSPSEMRSLILKNYFTWRFFITFMRRLGGLILRRMGLRKAALT